MCAFLSCSRSSRTLPHAPTFAPVLRPCEPCPSYAQSPVCNALMTNSHLQEDLQGHASCTRDQPPPHPTKQFGVFFGLDFLNQQPTARHSSAANATQRSKSAMMGLLTCQRYVLPTNACFCCGLTTSTHWSHRCELAEGGHNIGTCAGAAESCDLHRYDAPIYSSNRRQARQSKTFCQK